MVFVSIHNVEKLKTDKFWLDSGTFVVKLKFKNNKNEFTEITIFSKHSEPFKNIISNEPIEKINSN